MPAELEPRQKALREIVASHSNVLEALNEGIFLTDLNDIVLYCNGRMEEWTGYRREELVGISAYERLLPPEKWPEHRERNARRAQGVLDIYEEEIVRKDGATRWFEIRASPLRNPAGEIVGTLSANTDITERKQVEEARRTAAVLEERQRLAREIHDTLAQAFTGITVQLGAAGRVLEADSAAAKEHLERAREMAREGLAEARRSVGALRSEALEGQNLCDTLARLVERMTAGTPPQAAFHAEGTPRSLPPEVGLHLLRIGQEALTNAVKYAGASAIAVELAFTPQQVSLRVHDDGQGFDLSRFRERRGFGLTTMRERSERMGGVLTINSQPGAGTEVKVTVPLPAEGEGRGRE